MLRWLLVAASILCAGCVEVLAPEPEPVARTGDCGTGKAHFLLVVLHNKDFYNTAEEVQKDRFHTVDRQGRMFGYIGLDRPGMGRVVASTSSLHNVTAADVLAQLKATGQWDAQHDYHVEQAWRASVPAKEYAQLCKTLIEEKDMPSDAGERRVSCADGGTHRFNVSARGVDWQRTVGCLPDASEAEYQSSNRVMGAFSAAAGAARATIGLE